MLAELPALPLAVAGFRDSQTQINAALMVLCAGWAGWGMFIVADSDESVPARGRNWLVAFIGIKGFSSTLLFTISQATALDREFLANSVYVGTGALAYSLWGEFMVRRWPGLRAPRIFRVLGWGGIAAWLLIGAWRGPAIAWTAWPWLVVAPVIAGAGWAARHERRLAFGAIGAALLIEFADPRTVLSWFTGFVGELSLTWEQLSLLAPDAARPAPGNGLLVVPVSGEALAWFVASMVAVWTGFISWQYDSGVRRARLWVMPCASVVLAVTGFVIYGLSLAVAFRSMSRETFSRLDTLASVAPWGATTSSPQSAAWRALRHRNSELGEVFRWQLSPAGERVVLDPLSGHASAGLPILPFERAAIVRGEAYGMGPFMHWGGPAFYSAVPAGRAADGSPQWLAVIGPLERFYLYKRPSALLGNVVIFLFGLVGVVALGYMLHRERGLRQRLARERAEEDARTKTTFLAKVSHELRTPLQSLLGYSELLASGVTTDAARGHLSSLRQHGDLMLRLVNDLLDLSAIESGAFRLLEKPAPLAELIRQTVDSLRPRAAAKGLALHCTIDPQLPPWVATDAERVRQIALNLVGNAVKFTEQGRIDVALQLLAQAPGTLTLELAVTDTGPGIAPEQQARLFRAFSRLELATPKEGSGLGLALSAALCRSAGGDLTVDSDGRNGSCFRARLRVGSTTVPAVAEPAGPVASLRDKRVLVVDDNSLVRDLFAAWLLEMGATCEVAVDGQDAIARAAATPFDAVVLDLAMPKVDGLEVTRLWRNQGHQWRIVGVSAHAGAGDRVAALAAGMDAFLTKPVQLAELAMALAVEPALSSRAASFARVRAELVERFRSEATAQGRAVQEALTRRDWKDLRARAHYLKNSAGVVGDERLYDSCTALEDAADQCDIARSEAAWTVCSTALAAWSDGAPKKT